MFVLGAIEFGRVLWTQVALQYAVEADTDGETWPRGLVAGDRSGAWHHILIENIAQVLPEMVGAA